MDNFLYINACKTSLSAGITPQATKIYISNPSRFPGAIPQGYVLVLVLHPDGLPSTQEIVHCTEIDADQLTVVRGAQGTAPASWPAGTVVGAYLTAEMLSQIAADVNGHAGSGGDAHAPATPLVDGFMAAADKAKLNGVQAGATNYQHPANHVPGIITQDSNNRFATDTEKGNWNAAKNHADSTHAPSNAQKNSDITKGEIEAKLIGAIGSHSHAAYLPLTGGTMTGQLAIQNAAPMISFIDTDNNDRALLCNSNRIGFLNSGGNWSFYSQDDGVNVSPNSMVIGSSTHSMDGNVFMPWAGDWLSNVLASKVSADSNFGIGCIAFLHTSNGVSPGGLVSGNNLRPASINSVIMDTGSTLNYGTWRCLGRGADNMATNWQRIA